MIMLKQYSLRLSGSKKLTPHLSVREFACHDGSDAILISDPLPEVLEAIRNHFGKPLRITSGYRTPAWNRKVGGVAKSQHTLGTAADINIDDETPLAVYRAIVNGWVAGVDPERLGVGLYLGFVHVDVRGHRARWHGAGVEGVEE